MFYRICLILNSALSFLFMFLTLFILLDKGDSPNPPFDIGIAFIFSCAFLIWFNFICFRIDKMNKEQISISKRLKLSGEILFVLIALFALIIFSAALIAIIQVHTLDHTQKSPSMLSMIIVASLLILVGITTISNLVFFVKSLKRNKILVTDFINDIGVK
jgi:hypothetical protein